LSKLQSVSKYGHLKIPISEAQLLTANDGWTLHRLLQNKYSRRHCYVLSHILKIWRHINTAIADNVTSRAGKNLGFGDFLKLFDAIQILEIFKRF